MTTRNQDTFLSAICSGIEKCLAQDPEYKSFGADSHRYSFTPPCSIESLTAWEKELGIVFPEEYRAFLAAIGNGGAGPSYGLMPFQGGDSEDYTNYKSLSHAFAYTESFNPPVFVDDDGNTLHEDYWKSFDSRGALYICHHGCGSRSMLIVTGPCRGEVWADGVADEHGYKPELRKDGSRHSFATWYLAWLERAG